MFANIEVDLSTKSNKVLRITIRFISEVWASSQM